MQYKIKIFINNFHVALEQLILIIFVNKCHILKSKWMHYSQSYFVHTLKTKTYRRYSHLIHLGSMVDLIIIKILHHNFHVALTQLIIIFVNKCHNLYSNSLIECITFLHTLWIHRSQRPRYSHCRSDQWWISMPWPPVENLLGAPHARSVGTSSMTRWSWKYKQSHETKGTQEGQQWDGTSRLGPVCLVCSSINRQMWPWSCLLDSI